MTHTQLRISWSVPTVFGVAVLGLGVGLGLGLPSGARWLEGVLDDSSLPTPGPVRLVGDMSVAWTLPLLTLLGLGVGLFLAAAVVQDTLRLDIHDDHLEHRRGDLDGWVERADVGAVYRDRKELVLVGADGAPRATLLADGLDDGKVERAMRAHGWPWHESDPYDADYGPWMDGRPGFTAEEHALLRRRHAARTSAAECREADDLLAAAGLAVRARGRRLEVRRMPRATA